MFPNRTVNIVNRLGIKFYWRNIYFSGFRELKIQPSYRPIALSGVLGKLFQEILNKRLLRFLESKKLRSPFQYGFRKRRNTGQPLLDLQKEINEVLAVVHLLYCINYSKSFPRIFFDPFNNKTVNWFTYSER